MTFCIVSDLKVMLMRINFGLKVLWRDKGSRYSFTAVFFMIGFWIGNEMIMRNSDPSYNF